MLRSNDKLTALDLYSNAIGDEGGGALLSALEAGRHALVACDLRGNQLPEARACAPHGHRTGTTWAPHGHHMGTTWAPHGHRMVHAHRAWNCMRAHGMRTACAHNMPS